MEKVFKSRYLPNSSLKVKFEGDLNALHLLIGKPGANVNDAGIHLAPADAPAIALAILEAAGVAESSDEGVAAEFLRASIAEQARAAAEAKERAELEAEGYELYLSWAENVGCSTLTDSLDDMHQIAKDQWIAVARKARELNPSK